MDIILGSAQLTEHYGIMSNHDQGSRKGRALLLAATELGLSTIDTSPAYGSAESLIGHEGKGFVVHTKLPGVNQPSQELSDSLKRLQRTFVSVVYLHKPDVVLNPSDPRIALAAELVGAGIEHLGASIYTREQFTAAVADPRVDVIQLPLNVLDRRIADAALQDAARLGKRLIARSALLQGLLGDPAAAIGRLPALDAAIAAFGEACRTLERDPVEVAIQWVVARPGLSGLVIGAESPIQLQRLVRAAAAAPLAADEARHLAASIPLPAGTDIDPRRWPARRDSQRENR